MDHEMVTSGRAGEQVGILGASSFVGDSLLELAGREGVGVVPFSRTPEIRGRGNAWRRLCARDMFRSRGIDKWISLCPIMALPELLPLLELTGVRRLVAVSSTSLITKKTSSDARERHLAGLIERSEFRVGQWASMNSVEVVLLRTTLTYDGLRDANIAAMGRFIERWGILPILEPASGLRQPLHGSDLAEACWRVLGAESPRGCYNLSGGETLSYREMAGRVFDALGMPRRFVGVPSTLIAAARFACRILPGGFVFPAGMFERMNVDMVFAHDDAALDLGFRPRGFRPKFGDALVSRSLNECC